MIKKWFKYYVLRESIKEIELNSILDKISNGKLLTDRENNFLNLYNDTLDSDLKDYSYLSRYLVTNKISEYLDRNKKIYCDLYDRDGKISQLILSVDKITFKLTLKHGEYTMEDRYLYNLIYDIKKDQYSLTVQDEYFEEINVTND